MNPEADPEVASAMLDRASAWLEEKLGYRFSDEQLLRMALTHRSAPGSNNERLEFLGDAILDVVVSEVIYRLRPEASEGVMSRIRASLVKDPALARLATSIDLGEHLVLGPGERRTGGHHRQSILADALEAIFGAVYLDSGFESAREVIRRAYGDRLETLPESASLRDPKTRLQELLQSRKIGLPAYEVENITGKAHQQSFEVRCTVTAIDASTIGHGSSRRRAEQEAATGMLELLADHSE
jgi:ribonuclease-3